MLGWQNVITAALVAASFCYAAGSLMPARWRRNLADALLHWPIPLWMRLRLSQATGSSACQCDGCDQSSAAPVAEKKIIFMQRRP
jgi:hypothetical protein